METLSQIREDVAPYVGDSGVCLDSEDILKAVNDARRILYRLGHWKGTTEKGLARLSEGQITLPYRLDYGIKAWTYVGKLNLDNRWWRRCTGNVACGCNLTLDDLGDEYGSFSDNQGVPFRIRAYCDLAEDIGKVVLFHCEDEYGQRVILRRELQQGAINEWGGIDHGSIEDSYVSRIFQVTKESTNGRVFVTAFCPVLEVVPAPPVSDEVTWDSDQITFDSEIISFDSGSDIDGIIDTELTVGESPTFDDETVNFDDPNYNFDGGSTDNPNPTDSDGDRLDNETLIAIYGPQEVNPHYRRYSVCGCVKSTYQIVVEAKKKYFPLVEERETVDIATEAIIHALQAITARKNRNIQEFNVNVQLATTYLNKELAQSHPFKKRKIKWESVSNTNLEGAYY